MASLWVASLGVVPYTEALELQREVARRRIDGTIPEDVLLLVEHPPVITLGRSSKQRHLMASPELLRARGVELFEVERGGDVTFHGPGQLVGYPVVNLKRHRQDLHWYLRQLEEVLIGALATHGLTGARSEGQTGVWVENRKIASIGVHARDWVTWHGFALNVATDLAYFDMIVPCGIQDVVMTSMAREGCGVAVAGDAEAAITRAFGEVFGLDVAPIPEETTATLSAGEALEYSRARTSVSAGEVDSTERHGMPR